jgi:hypothetical protein
VRFRAPLHSDGSGFSGTYIKLLQRIYPRTSPSFADGQFWRNSLPLPVPEPYKTRGLTLRTVNLQQTFAVKMLGPTDLFRSDL